MAKSKTIRVTPNMLNCFKTLKEAVQKLPPGVLKKKASFAINYMNRTFKGEPQPRKMISCPGDRPIVG